MTENDKITLKFQKIDYFGKLIQFLFLVHTVVTYGSGLGREMASRCNKGLSRTQKWPKKDLKMSCLKHTQKLMKNNENFFSAGQFFHSYRLSGDQGADNCKEFNHGIKNRPVEVEIKTKNDQK